MRILLADDNAARAGALTKVLAADPGLTVLRPRAGELLADAVAALAPDVVLVDMARPDRDALEGIRVVASNAPRPIVLFVDQDDPAFMEEAIGAGVSSYNVPGVPLPDVKPILRAAAAMFRHHQIARDGLRQAESRLRERETIDRAKAILIRERHMAEPDAYRWLRTRAMSTGKRIPDIAREVVHARDTARAPGIAREHVGVRPTEIGEPHAIGGQKAGAEDGTEAARNDRPVRSSGTMRTNDTPRQDEIGRDNGTVPESATNIAKNSKEGAQ